MRSDPPRFTARTPGDRLGKHRGAGSRRCVASARAPAGRARVGDRQILEEVVRSSNDSSSPRPRGGSRRGRRRDRDEASATAPGSRRARGASSRARAPRRRRRARVARALPAYRPIGDSASAAPASSAQRAASRASSPARSSAFIARDRPAPRVGRRACVPALAVAPRRAAKPRRRLVAPAVHQERRAPQPRPRSPSCVSCRWSRARAVSPPR